MGRQRGREAERKAGKQVDRRRGREGGREAARHQSSETERKGGREERGVDRWKAGEAGR